MTTNQKRHLESEFALFQTSPILFSFIQFVKCWRNSLGLNPKGPYLSLEKERENFCAVLTNSIERAHEIRKFHVAIVQRLLRNVQKSVMHVQSCCFASINLLVFCRSRCCRRRPCSSLLVLARPCSLTIVVIQSFCYHSNVTSHLSSLLVFSLSEIVVKKFIFLNYLSSVFLALIQKIKQKFRFVLTWLSC